MRVTIVNGMVNDCLSAHVGIYNPRWNAWRRGLIVYTYQFYHMQIPANLGKCRPYVLTYRSLPCGAYTPVRKF